MKNFLITMFLLSFTTFAAPLPPVVPDLHPVDPSSDPIPSECFCIGGVIPTSACQEDVVCQ